MTGSLIFATIVNGEKVYDIAGYSVEEWKAVVDFQKDFYVTQRRVIIGGIVFFAERRLLSARFIPNLYFWMLYQKEEHMRKISLIFVLVAALLLLVAGTMPDFAAAQPKGKPITPLPVPDPVLDQPAPVIMWINHLAFLPGDPSVITSFNAVDSGVGSGLSGLIIESTTTGENAEPGGNKVVERGLDVPPGYLITGVRVCYELSDTGSFISQIRLAQVQDPPAAALVVLDDGTDLLNAGPLCVDSAQPLTAINPADGGLRLSFRVNFGNITDRIVIRAVALNMVVDPNSPIMQELLNHTHIYLTGKGIGHNNTQATTSPSILPAQ